MFYNTSILQNTSERDLRLASEVVSLCGFIHDKAFRHPHKNSFDFNCHPIHRAIACIIPDLTVVDGTYLGLAPDDEDQEALALYRCDHSWLHTPDGAIIDAYPCGFMSMNPVLVQPKAAMHLMEETYTSPTLP